jgi:peroxiredoxin
LADEDKSVIQAFGVWGPKKFMGKEYDGIHRTTFVIDENGIIWDENVYTCDKEDFEVKFNFCPCCGVEKEKDQ